MKITINRGSQLQSLFRAAGHDDFSYDGYDALVEYYGDTDLKGDPVDIRYCCTEYGDADGAACSLDDMVHDYGHLIEDEIEEDDTLNDLVQKVLDAVFGWTTVLKLPNGNYIVFKF